MMVVPGPGGVQGRNNPVDTPSYTQVGIPEIGVDTRLGISNMDDAAYFYLIVFLNIKNY